MQSVCLNAAFRPSQDVDSPVRRLSPTALDRCAAWPTPSIHHSAHIDIQNIAAAGPPTAAQLDAAQPAAGPVAAVPAMVDESARRASAGGLATLDNGWRGDCGDAIKSLPGGTIVVHPVAKTHWGAAAEATSRGGAKGKRVEQAQGECRGRGVCICACECRDVWP